MSDNPKAAPSGRVAGLVFAVALAAAAGLAFQGTRGLWESTEGRYAECARQMWAHGSLLKPILNGHGHWTKPPATYWAIIAGCKLLGWNAWGARLYLALSLIIATAAVYFTAEELWGRESGGICAAVYATSPYVLGGSFSVSTDMLLAMWIAIAGMFFWRGLRRSDAGSFIWMWAAFAGAFMTKGPPALLSLSGIIPTYLIARRKDATLPALMPPIAIPVFLFLSFGWYAYAALTNEGLMHYWLAKEVVERNVTDEAGRNPEWYKAFMYPGLLGVGAGFWVLWLAQHGRHLPWPRENWRRPMTWRNGLEWTYIILAVLPPMTVFMLIRSRLYLYTLPLMAPVAMAVGRGIRHLVDSGRIRPGAVMRVAALSCAAFVSVKAYAGIKMEPPRDMRALAELVKPDLEAFDQRRSYLVGGEPLYGLQFYLGEELIPLPDMNPPVEQPVQVMLEKHIMEDFTASRVPVIFGRIKDFEEISEAVWGLRNRNPYSPRARVLLRARHIEYGFLALTPQVQNARILNAK